MRVPHLSSDGIRTAIAPGPYDPALRDVVYDGLQAMLESALAAGMSVLLDANYLDSARRTRVREIAAAHGARLLSVLVRCALDSRRARNRPRPTLERVPEGWLESAHSRAETLQGEADRVIDTDLVTPEAAAESLMRWLLASASLPPA